MLAFLGHKLVGQIAGPLCAALLCLLLVSRCDNAVLKGQVRKAQQEAAQVRLDLGQCRVNKDELQHAIDKQNADIAVLESEGKRIEAETAKRLAEARKKTEAAQRASQRLLRPLTANDQCSRVIEADKRVLEDLR